eukprot:2230403-Lingulodinium_polyedra.AAC.1
MSQQQRQGNGNGTAAGRRGLRAAGAAPRPRGAKRPPDKGDEPATRQAPPMGHPATATAAT